MGKDLLNEKTHFRGLLTLAHTGHPPPVSRINYRLEHLT